MKLSTAVLVPVMFMAIPACAMQGRGEGSAAQQNDQPADLSQVPDEPLDTLPQTPVAPRFVVEHRSALNDKVVVVRGFVVRVVLREDTQSPPQSPVAPAPGASPRPRIFLADSLASQPEHQLIVLLREGESGYSVGDLVELRIRVDGTALAVVAQKLYTID